DPLALDFTEPWTGPRPDVLINSLSAPGGGEGWGEVGDSGALAGTHLTLPALRDGPLPLPPEGRRGELAADPPWRTAGDTVERLEALALRLVSGTAEPAPDWHRTRA